MCAEKRQWFKSITNKKRRDHNISLKQAFKVGESHSIVRHEEKEPVRNRRGPNHCHESHLHFPWVAGR